MKRLATIIAALFVASASMSAQGDMVKTESMVRTNAGDLSMLFTLNGLQNIGAGNFMGGVGAGYYLSNNMQLRGGLGFGTSTTTTGEGTSEAKTSSTTFTIAPALRLNLVNSSNVVAYTGVQVAFTSGSGSTTAGGTETGTSSSSTIGAGILLGTEWFPWRNVSLGLEYGLGYSSSSSSQTPTGGTEQKGPTTSGINLGLSTVQFMLGFYFN